MCDALKHEEWYNVEKFIDKPIYMARISSCVFNPEVQPIFNEDETLCIMMDGEIYDYQNVKEDLISKNHKFSVNNSPEFILHLYEQKGKDFVQSLNGSFVLTIWDRKKQELLIINDRYGLRPLYYTKNNGRLLYGSEIKAILTDETFDKIIDWKAVADFFAFEFILGNKTFFQGISVLPPASILSFKKNKLSIEQYWDFKYEEKKYSEEFLAAELAKQFRKAVEIRMQDEKRKGLFLSGGLDSRSILAATNKKFHTYTFGKKGCDDSKIARAVSNEKKMKNKFLELEGDEFPKFAEKAVYLSDGLVNVFHFHAIGLMDIIKDEVDVIFDGLALDLSLGGSYLKADNFCCDETSLPDMLFKKTNKLFTEDVARQLFSKEYSEKIKGKAFNSLKTELDKLEDKNIANKSDHFFLQNRVRRFTLMSSVYIRNKIELVTPTYDLNFMNVILTVPPELRLNHRIYRKFLKNLDKELAKIPYGKTGIRPDAPEVLRRTSFVIHAITHKIKQLLKMHTRGTLLIPDKRRYTAYDEWIRKNPLFRKFVKQILLDEKTLKAGYLNRDFLQKMINDHMNYRKDYSIQLCALITFEIWRRLFTFDDSKKKMKVSK